MEFFLILLFIKFYTAFAFTVPTDEIIRRIQEPPPPPKINLPDLSLINSMGKTAPDRFEKIVGSQTEGRPNVMDNVFGEGNGAVVTIILCVIFIGCYIMFKVCNRR